MSVLVKSMEMPENCALCPMCQWNFDGNETRLACRALKDWADNSGEGRLQCCPLVEVPTPHGRLIDVDELQKILVEDRYDKILNRYGSCSSELGMLVGAIKLIGIQPTVIEAEGE